MASPYNLRASADGLLAKRMQSVMFARVVDFSLFTGTAAGVANDVAQIIDIPANFVVESVCSKVITAGTASSTYSVGDSGTANGFITVTTGKADDTAGTLHKPDGSFIVSSFATTPAVNSVVTSLFKHYSTADHIDVKLGATPPTTGKILVMVKGFFDPLT